MPYKVGERGSYGCKGYPVVKEDGEVMGCHATAEDAGNQVQALYANEAQKADTGIVPTQTSSTDAIYPSIGIKRPRQGRAKSSDVTGSSVKSSYGKKPRVRRGRSGDALNSDGAIASGGSGGSMGTKSNDADFWAGSAFGKRR